jgi:triosephosphate isomerase
MRRLFVAGNWKMNLRSDSARALAQSLLREMPDAIDHVQLAVCPPFPYLSLVRESLGPVGHLELGAQNVWHEPPGAFTGEVSCDMLLDVGCRWVILGHSERRHILGETSELVSRKAAKALAAGLGVILCVGETLPQREAGQTDAVLDQQMTGSLALVDSGAVNRLVIAYEPVWAIGTGVTATTEQAQMAHACLRSWLSGRYNRDVGAATRILYGGSVKPQNARALLDQPDVDGALVGGASLKVEDFVPIVRAARAAAAAR